MCRSTVKARVKMDWHLPANPASVNIDKRIKNESKSEIGDIIKITKSIY